MKCQEFSEITPVLLAGGLGTRLWPLSRKSYPKQFSNFIGDMSLFQASAQRLTSSEGLSFAAPLTMTNADFRFIVVEQLQAIGIEPGAILIEPETKNTAPAILAACLYAVAQDRDAILLVAPSDHVIPQVAAFHAAIALGLDQVAQGKMVTFGITPTRVETGYGYLELDALPKDGAVALKSFVEKPDSQSAAKMIEAGHYLWNAGIFLFKAQDMITAFEAYAPDLLKPVTAALTNGCSDLGFFRLAPEAWSQCADISVDYAVMEQASNLSVVPYSAGWSDLGGWDAVWQEQSPDAAGIVTSENVTAIKCTNTLLRSEHGDQHLVGLGLENIIAVAMPDAVLVADMSKAQEVKQVVTRLKTGGVHQAETFPKDHRPWGWFETLAIRGRFQVKCILVNPGASLSLQSHHHRSEHWIVVEGTAKVTINEAVKIVTEGQSVYIPLGAVHRMQNPGKMPMVLIEVQTGAYLGEDDIIRYEDQYARS